MSTVTIIISLLAILAGYVSQAIQTGSLFGVATVPKKWVPYLTLFGAFLAAAVPSISGAASKDESAWLTALFAGLVALGSTTVGVTAHQHLNAAPPKVPPTNPEASPATPLKAA